MRDLGLFVFICGPEFVAESLTHELGLFVFVSGYAAGLNRWQTLVWAKLKPRGGRRNISIYRVGIGFPKFRPKPDF